MTARLHAATDVQILAVFAAVFAAGVAVMTVSRNYLNRTTTR